MEEEKVVQVRFICCLRTMPFELTLDKEGFMVCPDHKQRRYGWRSARKKQHKVSPFNPEKPEYVYRPDYSETRLEQDQAIVRDLFVDLFVESEMADA